MPFLDELVTSLNNVWKSKLPSDIKLRLNGIVETVLEVDQNERTKKFPAVIDNNGDAVVDENRYSMIDIDDDYKISIYHRLESITNSTAKQGFGDDPGNSIEVANMAVIVIAFRNGTGIIPHKLEALLKDTIPYKFRKMVNGKEVQQSVFKVGNSNFDKLQLLNREYSEVEINYPDLIMFEMKYQITTTYKKGCIASSMISPDGGIGSIQLIDSTEGTLSDPTGKYYQVDFEDVLNTTISVYLDKAAVIDWGDGSQTRSYAAESVVNKVYQNQTDPVQLKVYWEQNGVTVFWVQSGGQLNTALVTNVAGDFPLNLNRFQISNGLSVFPFDKLSTATRYIDLRRCSFTSEDLNEILAFCNQTGISNGYLDISFQTTEAEPSDTQAYQELQNKGWVIII